MVYIPRDLTPVHPRRGTSVPKRQQTKKVCHPVCTLSAVMGCFLLLNLVAGIVGRFSTGLVPQRVSPSVPPALAVWLYRQA